MSKGNGKNADQPSHVPDNLFSLLVDGLIPQSAMSECGRGKHLSCLLTFIVSMSLYS